ncbi:MAG: phosphatidylserine decarboxylase [Ruminococcaceae bacterium]|nr:phosphatidylserine decarboxylase [Oscillospiraceae bacterium]
MTYKDRQGNLIEQTTGQDRFLHNLYTRKAGRIVIKVMTRPFLSKIAGFYLSRSISKIHIKRFVKKQKINMDDYMPQKYTSYNDFFTRPIKPERRPVDMNTNVLISPADGKVTVYKIGENTPFEIKNSRYTVESILRDKELAAKYTGGWCVVVRLSVDNYHRYCYIDDGIVVGNRYIKGILHTVNPIATAIADVYKENSREYTVIQTKNFGTVTQIEVGATMVGRIVNYPVTGPVTKGQEKGKFEFGGSTVVLLLQQDAAAISDDIIQNTLEGHETLVKMGENIGTKII